MFETGSVYLRSVVDMQARRRLLRILDAMIDLVAISCVWRELGKLTYDPRTSMKRTTPGGMPRRRVWNVLYPKPFRMRPENCRLH